jgi:tetraacyldisaccharide-1-P 4'-kinase
MAAEDIMEDDFITLYLGEVHYYINILISVLLMMNLIYGGAGKTKIILHFMLLE